MFTVFSSLDAYRLKARTYSSTDFVLYISSGQVSYLTQRRRLKITALQRQQTPGFPLRLKSIYDWQFQKAPLE